MNKKVLVVSVVVVVTSLLLAACGGSSGGAGVTVTLKAQDIKFDLKEIKAKANQPVVFNYVNEGTLEHNFIVKDFNVKETIPAGGKKTITFTPTKAGTQWHRPEGFSKPFGSFLFNLRLPKSTRLRKS
ncbi:MAG: cupredoxin domain-containing protein [Chloroflexi bacterium]|nr:cupredoxin domain-containing protein [Chloroflexota bacterium]